MRKLGVEPSRTVILRIPGEWYREFARLADGRTVGETLREALEDFLKREGRLE